ncbi:conserved hypothetical protein [Histoplasma capsulatum H143]|uniref:Uncharacterized protein n=1 Tax=Ajellomyces capsulatus (strain H143) TaxID=544712 RepID=C6H6P6_AJECH|nr:conserved hypothetical protein [Histoplasma capsulatum H143]
MDIEHLIALLTEVDPQNELPRRANTPLEDTFHERLRIVLDAIASVLVSKPRGEVIAVGMRSQQNGLGKKIILTLASNTGIPKKTYQHARNLINDLKKLGADFADYRKSAEQEIHTSQIKPQQSEPGRVDSPEIDERNLPPHLRQKIYLFRRRVLLFALPKIHQRLHKGYKPTKSSRGLTFVRIAEELDINSNGSVNILKECSMIINWMLHHLPNNSRLFPIEKEDYVVEGLNSIAGMVDELFETKTWLADIPKTSSKIDALPYIGVSKLSCVACWEFFNALHKVDCMFYVRGSHSKAYFPWKFPDVEMNTAKLLESEKEKILKSFYSDLAATYTQRFKAKERLRRMSESSTGSTKPIPRDRWPAEKFPWGS